MKIFLNRVRPQSDKITLEQPFSLFIEAIRGTGSGTLQAPIELRCQSDTLKISPATTIVRLIEGNDGVIAPVQVTIKGVSNKSFVVVEAVNREEKTEQIQSCVLRLEEP